MGLSLCVSGAQSWKLSNQPSARDRHGAAVSVYPHTNDPDPESAAPIRRLHTRVSLKRRNSYKRYLIARLRTIARSPNGVPFFEPMKTLIPGA